MNAGEMMRVPSIVTILAVTLFAAACGGKPEPEPTPEPTPAPTPAPAPTTAPAPAPRDDSAERSAREAEERRRALMAQLTTMINFDYDQAAIRSADQTTMDQKATILAANPNVRIRIAGHADDRGSDEYNLALGNRRAAAAKRYLENKGVDGSRVEVISYGEERPLSQGNDEAAYAQNRRDEFEVTAGADNLVAPQ